MPQTNRVLDGAAAREVRLALGLSIAETARRAAISPSNLSNIEAGRRTPRLITTLALAAALGVHPDRISTSRVVGARSAS